MKHLLSYAICIISWGIASVSSTALAQTTGNGPYYATPSWDQTLPSSTRFIVLSNMNSEAVLDRETGLVWEKTPSLANFEFPAAHNHCNSSGKGGRVGWRLPTIQELGSVVDRTMFGPSLPAGHPFNVPAPFVVYRSATTLSSNTSEAWAVSFDKGDVFTFPKVGVVSPAWCVRGGQGVDPQ